MHAASAACRSRRCATCSAMPRSRRPSRYDNQKLENLQAAVLRLESGKTFDAATNDRVENRIDDADKVSSFFQEKAKVPGSGDQKGDRQSERKRKNQRGLSAWLGGRDSNPDNVVQSHVSYRWTTSQCQSRRAAAAGTSHSNQT